MAGNILRGIQELVTDAAIGTRNGIRSGLNKPGVQSFLGMGFGPASKRAMSMSKPAMMAAHIKSGRWKPLARTAKGYFGASDFRGRGLARVGVGAARGAAASTGMALGMWAGTTAADFFNPFGFGSLDD